MGTGLRGRRARLAGVVPSNPLLTIADVRAICWATRKPSSLLAVDNTVATSLNQRPLELGADISLLCIAGPTYYMLKSRVAHHLGGEWLANPKECAELGDIRSSRSTRYKHLVLIQLSG